MDEEPVTPAKHTNKPPRCGNVGLRQAYILRDLAANKAFALQTMVAENLSQAATLAKAIKDLTSVWVDATERIRILRGRPLPGSLRPQGAKKKRKAHSGPLFTELPADPSVQPDP